MKQSSTDIHSRQYPPHPHRRRGAILVISMICLLLITVLLGSLIKLAGTHHRQMRYEQHHLQADWLAESALERAADRLAADAGYSGETWEIPADTIGGTHAGQVTISIEPIPERAGDRNAVAVAVYPSDTTRFARRTKELNVRVKAEP